jgi:hypothetical protein
MFTHTHPFVFAVLLVITCNLSLIASQTNNSSTIKSVLLSDFINDEIEYEKEVEKKKHEHDHDHDLEKPVQIESLDYKDDGQYLNSNSNNMTKQSALYDQSKMPDSIKQSKNKQSIVENVSMAPTTSNVNSIHVTVPIIVVLLFVIVGLVFVHFKRKAVAQRRAPEANARPVSSAIYTPIVTQRENLELSEV